MALKKCETGKNVWKVLFYRYKSLNDACMPYIFKILVKIKSLLLIVANGRAC